MAAAPNDWQLECTKLKQRGAYLLKSGQWTDCTFLVGTEPNQVVIEGHKLILAMASPVFEAMFFGGMAEGNEPIPILDVQIDAFKALLEYIYTDNINITSFDKACELCYGAKKYMLPHLVKECTRYLWSDLYPRNACRAYEFANLFEENNLMEKCIQIISTNTKEILNDSSFEEMDINTVITVFSLDHLNIDSELDLFEAIVRYAKAAERRNAERSASPAASTSNSDRKSIMPSTSQEKEQVVNVESSAESSPAAAPEPCRAEHEPQPETSKPKGGSAGAGAVARALVRPALERVRFLTLSAQQFAAGPARSTLLTESEAFAVLMNILSTSDVPMPRGFSTSRTPRKTLLGSHFAAPDYSLSVSAVDTPSPVSLDVVWLPSSDHRPDRAEHRPDRAEHRPDRADLRAERAQPWDRAAWDRPARHELQNIITSSGALLATRAVDGSAGAGAGAERGEHRSYCRRALVTHTDFLNTSVLDSSVTFMVDKNICVLGVQVPTQAPSEEGGAGQSLAGGYCELLYAHLLDADGARLTYTHYTSRVLYRHLLDIMFNRPVYVQRNKVYKVGIVFNKVGWYPMGTAAQQVLADAVHFNFGVGQSADSVRDGLIRSIIFTY
ncbi:uncharacterized protein LOC121739601 [Aricia agestis]|uniref:uncharacterized protein LOC121739601 n=1 Tax=Aricia agestis TaxID=91739 RepID=UPI001C203654|nr:uncharacterized protein LOC121739601 [Aricia agestis]